MGILFAKLIEPPKDYIPKEEQRFSNWDLKKLIVPLIIEQILVMFVGMADTMMVSYAGEAAISGVSLVDMVNNVCFIVFSSLATGGTIIVSQYMGSQNNEKANQSVSQLIMLSALLSMGLFLIMMMFHGTILKLLFGSIEIDVMKAATTYLVLSLFSYPFMAVYSACTALFRAMGNSKITMQISLIMNLINVVGNALGIFVFHAGVMGVAVASLISRLSACLILFLLLTDSHRVLRVRIKEIFSWNQDLVAKIMSVAIPSGVQSAFFEMSRVILVSIIATFGTAQIAANGVAVSIDNINIIINSGVSLAIPTVIGRCVGANDYRQATYYAKKMLLIAQFASLILCTGVFLSLPFILNLYSLSEEARNYAYILVCIHCLWTVLLGTSSGPLPTVLRSAGDVHFTMVWSIIGLLIGRLFCSYLFSIVFGWGIIGMWVAMATHWMFNSVSGYIRFRNGKWKTKRVI